MAGRACRRARREGRERRQRGQPRREFGGWARRWLAAAGLVVVAFLVGACQVNTEIAVDTTKSGSGTVEVTVTLDKAATAAVGDVKSELRAADLTAAGWRVEGPTTTAGGSTVVGATHPFVTLSEVSTLVAEIAGTGAAKDRPFQLQVVRHQGYWSSSTELRGRVDLRCDLGCFGDAGLRRQLGSSTGIDPGSAASQARDFTFGLSVTLPGTLKTNDASSVAGQRLTWTPRLGTETVLSATTTERNVGHIVTVAVAASVVLLAVIAGAALLVRRWRRRRPAGAHAARRH